MASMAEEQRRALEEAFGASDDDDDDDDGDEHWLLGMERKDEMIPVWESISEVNGLWVCRDFLPESRQGWLLSSIHQEGWFHGGSFNQNLLDLFVRAACFHAGEDHPLPLDLLWREPFFDQLIVNVYEPGEGICAHVDLMRFDDGIAIVSLESTCVMHFTRCKEESEKEGVEEDPSPRVPVLLTPGSLVLLSGEARYLWTHEINRKPSFQLWGGKEIQQERRTSVTLRKLCSPPNSG
ncbi:hypothetical protein J5N97_002075 [Dioscorea zingiberensis]|uniref:Fe2OG dioxygenase domain-containing protein n=1 Tax=Dioscorea zingiberensis TaxID=325984 RepID=A0A9D5BT06_9LILI|nr:hypothetical protein J5N97_002075 [Dioscorea zingiberensis]